MSEGSLNQLVEQARRGDRDAWGEVYRELSPLVSRLCRRILTNREDAEDATSEIFMKAQMRLDYFDPDRPFQAWLYRVAANHCWDLLRARRTRKHVDHTELGTDGIEAEGSDPLEQIMIRESREEIRRTLAQLDDRARLAVSLRYFAELTYEEIAEVLGVTSSFVGVLLLRARRRMRRILTEQDNR